MAPVEPVTNSIIKKLWNTTEGATLTLNFQHLKGSFIFTEIPIFQIILARVREYKYVIAPWTDQQGVTGHIS